MEFFKRIYSNIYKHFKFYLLIVILLLLFILLEKNELLIEYKLNKDIKKLLSYYQICKNGILINKKKFKKYDNPKISIIATIYNREKFILTFLRSIQNQFFDEIEILFIDDCSIDNSIKIIEFHQKQDERIVLIKNQKNKGTLIARNIGILMSKGIYVIIPDSDDILSKNILKSCYYLSKKYNYEMIRFNQYEQRTNGRWAKIVNKLKSYPIYQPQLSDYIFYALGYFKLNDFSVSNKFVKRELFIKTLNSINSFFLNQYMTIFEDGIINFALHRQAKSLYLLKEVGYYYLYNKQSTTKKKTKKPFIRFLFLYLKYVYENTKNTKYDKLKPFLILNKYIRNIKKVNSINRDFHSYIDIIDNYLECKFINEKDKKKLKDMKKLIINNKLNISKKKDLYYL